MKKLCLVFGICWAASSGCFGKDAYQFLSEIPIGGEGGWDILTIDPTRIAFICRTPRKLSLSI